VNFRSSGIEHSGYHKRFILKNKHTINPNDYRRTLCGVENGYQLDHKVSIKEAFENGWTPEQCADVNNLQMLSWKENREKWF
jgi:hypothetical protein